MLRRKQLESVVAELGTQKTLQLRYAWNRRALESAASPALGLVISHKPKVFGSQIPIPDIFVGS